MSETGRSTPSNAPLGASDFSNALARKLSTVAPLCREDEQALIALGRMRREIKPHRDLISDGDRPDYVILILSGWACRYKILENGARQITAFMLPGDLCDMHIMILSQMDHGIAALTSVTMAFISRGQFYRLTEDRPNIRHALWWSTLVDQGILRAWIVNNGRRSARERIAHLICELRKRIELIGLIEEEDFLLPITQIEIADAVGMTPVHVNRVIAQFATEGILEIRRGRTVVTDIDRLQRIAWFDPSYLHMEKLRGLPEGEKES